MTISSIMGTDSMKMARLMLPVVNSFSEPEIAIRRLERKDLKLFEADIKLIAENCKVRGKRKM